MKSQNNPPWKQLQKRIAFKSRYVTVRNDRVLRPDGKEGVYAYMEHSGGVGVVVLDRKGFVYLLREYKYPVRAFGLHLPSGGIEPGERPLQAAKRELKEEIGFTAQRWRALGALDASDGMSSERAHLFLAQGITTARVKPPPLEPLSIVRMPFKKAIRMVFEGKIACSYAITGLVRAAAMLKVVEI